ncbi:ATP-binding protein [Oceanivirga salmonicida]|uniref:ATP-binding protein n=1 Tax=Oceanivirga salmonicida TaxID=1769291 RepID=UPI00082DCAED|nr:ATP-binding protein [Oceanivirga salmonicida]
MSGNIKIEFYDDRVSIFSSGSLPNVLTLENIKNGSTDRRNLITVEALDKADYIENYATRIRRILDDYKNFDKQLDFNISKNIIIITLYNMNYINDTKNDTKNLSKREKKY